MWRFSVLAATRLPGLASSHRRCLGTGMATPRHTVKEVMSMYRNAGKDTMQDMDGTHCTFLSMPPLEHALQAAHRAAQATTREDFIIAALLHRFGNLLQVEGRDEANARVPTFGLCHAAGEWLRQRGFSRYVCDLISRQGTSQRYLCYADSSYYQDLSPSARDEVALMGGPMAPCEASAFEKQDLFAPLVALWFCCNNIPAKAKDAPRLSHYRSMMEDHLGDVLGEEFFWQDLGELGTYHVKR